MNKSLVFLAAGMGSRYGGVKQLKTFGPSGECILDYSIYDGIKAGFDDLVFIVRKDIQQDVYDHFMPRWGHKINIRFACQELDSFVGNNPYNKERAKPWGTAHALLCVKGIVKTPFAIINADDFYGQEAFIKASDFLEGKSTEEKYGLIYYLLGNTLSDHGSVNRGVCKFDGGHLTSIEECIDIYTSKEKGVGYEKNGKWYSLEKSCPVSMNFFCFTPSILDYAETYFIQFLNHSGMELKTEFLIPSLLQDIIDKEKKSIRVIPTNAKWFGVTYQEDNEMVIAQLSKLIAENVYPRSLFE